MTSVCELGGGVGQNFCQAVHPGVPSQRYLCVCVCVCVCVSPVCVWGGSMGTVDVLSSFVSQDTVQMAPLPGSLPQPPG